MGAACVCNAGSWRNHDATVDVGGTGSAREESMRMGGLSRRGKCAPAAACVAIEAASNRLTLRFPAVITRSHCRPHDFLISVSGCVSVRSQNIDARTKDQLKATLSALGTCTGLSLVFLPSTLFKDNTVIKMRFAQPQL